MITEQQSERMQVLRYPLIIGVVLVHASALNADIFAVGFSEVNRFVINFFSHSIGRISVPLLFVFSAFFLFLKLQPNSASYKVQMIKRVKGLLIPYILWNVIVLFLSLASELIPSVSAMISADRPHYSSMSLSELLGSTFGFSRYPISYQFWFIRNLILLCVISPVFFLLKGSVSKLTVLVLLLTAWVSNPFVEFSELIESITFFYVGFLLSGSGQWFGFIDKNKTLISVLFIALSFLDAFLYGSFLSVIIHKFSIILGCAFFILISLWIVNSDLNRFKSILISLSAASFFVFAAHEPTLTFVRKLLYKSIHLSGGFYSTFVYFSSTIITLLICTASYYILSLFFPKICAILTGGR